MAINTRSRTRMLAVSLACSTILATAPAVAEPTPVELGDVNWLRDFDHAVETSRSSGKPILVLFDEVPGCSTCVDYGRTALSHPLIVEAAEDLFVPVAVYNNVEGKDRAILTSFREPTWNNPVVRIIDADRNELTPRHANDYSVSGLASAMVSALEAQRPGSAPEYLRLVAKEREQGLERATFAMHCFWVGEAKLGAQEGVITTRTGWLDNSEVVELTFDSDVVSYKWLVKQAQSMECADRVFARSDEQRKLAGKIEAVRVERSDESMRATPKDDKYELAQTDWRFIPMTELQATRANALIEQGQDPSRLFSPRQREMRQRVLDDPDRPRVSLIGHADLKGAFKTFHREESRSGS